MRVQLRFKRYRISPIGTIGYKCDTDLPGNTTFFNNSLTGLVEDIEKELEVYGLVSGAVNTLFEQALEIDFDIDETKGGLK